MAHAGGNVPLAHRPQTTSATLDRVAPQNKSPPKRADARTRFDAQSGANRLWVEPFENRELDLRVHLRHAIDQRVIRLAG